jgi:hypothetical protein
MYRPLTAGDHTITAYAVARGQVWSTATLILITIDPTPPTANFTIV